MSRYSVQVRESVVYTVVVEATDEDDAECRAEDLVMDTAQPLKVPGPHELAVWEREVLEIELMDPSEPLTMEER